MVTVNQVTPILRIFDEPKAKEFYLKFLGFELIFEHRFEEGLPLYMGVSLGGETLHLSEHHGDACPGAHIRIQLDNVDEYQSTLSGKKYKYSNPSVGEETPWETREMSIDDPFGNRLTFYEIS